MLFGGKPRSAQKRKVEVPLNEPCLRCKELQALLDIANKTIKIMSVQIAKEAGKSKDVQYTGRHLSTASASFFGNEPSSAPSSWGAYPEEFDFDKFGSEEPSARAVKPHLAKVVDKPNVKAQEAAAVNVDKPKFDNIDLSADGADAVDAIIAQHQLDKKGTLFLFFCVSFCSRFTLFAAGGFNSTTLCDDLQKFKARVNSRLPVSPANLEKALTALADFSANQKLKTLLDKKQTVATRRTAMKSKSAVKIASKTMSKKKLNASDDDIAVDLTATKLAATKLAATKLASDADSSSSDSNSDSSNSDSDTSDACDVFYSQLTKNSTVVWGADAGEGKIQLCVALVTKRKQKPRGVQITYLLPVDADKPTGEWMGEMLSSGKYWSKFMSAHDIENLAFLVLDWEACDFKSWTFKMGNENWSMIVKRTRKHF